MTSRELIAAEANNTDRIALYREGLFWKAYERSAYALCTQVRPFKPTRKILKTLAGGDIVSVGFPTHAADRILAGLRRLDLPADAGAALGSDAGASDVSADHAAAPAGAAASAADSSLSCISDASSAAGASDAAVAVSVGADACAAGSVANASAGSCAAPHASATREPSVAHVSEAVDAAGSAAVAGAAAGSATRMVLIAPHPIVERDFLAWKSALPISLSIPRPSAAESSCEDPASGELSAHGLPLLGFSGHEAAPSRGRSLREVEPLYESSPHEVPRSALRPTFGRAASAGLAAPVGVADSAGSATLAGHAAPAPPTTASQPHWWTRLGGRLVRWAARAGAPRAAAASVSEAAAANAANPASSASAEQCLDALRKFEVADKTPMECMMFIAELKKRFLS